MRFADRRDIFKSAAALATKQCVGALVSFSQASMTDWREGIRVS
ncbi:MAG: hypothetical protein ACPHJ0_03315 [Arenicellales bacterium]